MKSLAALVALSLVLQACIPFGCGAYSGGGDKVYTRGNDVLVECENGGYVAMLSGGNQEGMLGGDGGVDPATDMIVFSQTPSNDGKNGLVITGSLAGNWAADPLDKTSLDHIDAVCKDLVNRSWWGNPVTAVTQVSEYTDGAGQNPVVLCPSGKMYFNGATTYAIADGYLDSSSLTGGIFANGTIVDNGLTWTLTTQDAARANQFCKSGIF